MALESCIGSTPESIFSITGISVLVPEDITTGRGGYIHEEGTPDLQIIGAIGRNSEYVNQLKKEVGTYMTRVNRAKLRSPRKYYNPISKTYQAYPPFMPINQQSNTALFLVLARQLAVLVYNRIVSSSFKIIQPIDPNTGEFCLPKEDIARNKVADALGIPTHGLLTASPRFNNVDKFGYTFTGVDVEVDAIFGNLIVPVKGLTAISWSSHADKNSDRRLHERTPKNHTRGARTVAGTLIFCLFDEDPIRAITPNQFFHGHIPISDYTGFSDFRENTPTEVPPFDLYITMTNEYGAVSAMSIFGIDITDDGGMISMRQIENEIVIQFKAIDYEPLKPVNVNPEGILGLIDDDAQAAFEQKRRMVLYGDMATRNFEEMYNSHLNNIVDIAARENERRNDLANLQI